MASMLLYGQQKNQSTQISPSKSQTAYYKINKSIKLADMNSYEWGLQQSRPSAQLFTSLSTKKKNYIENNKKNLYNFYKERIPKKEVTLYKAKQKIISPTKRLQMKQEESLKKMNTFISLKKSYKIDKYPTTIGIEKLNKTFLESGHKKQKIKAVQLQINRMNSTGVYRKATESSYMKRSQTAKKQAFIEVFGDDAFVEKKRENKTEGRIFKQKATLRKQNLNDQKQKRDRAQFSNLLKKLTEYSQQYNPFFKDQDDKSKRVTTQETNPEISDNSEMITWVKKITFDYQQKNIQIDNKMPQTTLKSVSDLQKIKCFNPKYFRDMVSHKRGRLKYRQQLLNQKIDIQSLNLTTPLGFNQQLNKMYENQSCQSKSQNRQQNLSILLTITDRNFESLEPARQTPVRLPKFKCSLAQKIRNLVHNLISSIKYCSMYGINRHDIYHILWRQKKPFELQGSYTFFKYIKSDDAQIIFKFIKENKEYSYQIDSSGRSALMYASQNNSLKAVNYLLSLGVNVDEKAYNKKTALFYALKNNNYDIVCSLLMHGANPWSTKQNNYSDLLKICKNSIKIAMKNSRRLHIGMNLMKKFSQRQIFWRDYKQKIRQKNILVFV